MLDLNKTLSRIKDWLPWSIPVKLGIAAVFSAIGGAGLVGYLTEYATYYYCIHYGFRPPLEGTPYLKAAVTFGSFFFLVSGAALYAMVLFWIRSFGWATVVWPRWAARKLLGPEAIKDERHTLNLLQHKPLVWAIGPALGLGVVMFLSSFVVARFDPSALDALPPLPTMLLIDFGFAAVFTIAIARPHAIWWQALAATSIYFLVLIYLMFSPDKYSAFLRLVGYGGGLPVEFHLSETDEKNSQPQSKGHLMLRTNEAMIVYVKDSRAFIEIPNARVKQVSYQHGGLLQLRYELPPHR